MDVSLVPLFGDLAASTLKRVTICIPHLQMHYTLLPELAAGFEAMCRYPNVLEEVYFTEQFRMNRLYDPAPELKQLDIVLGSSAWPCLRKVCITIDTDRSSHLNYIHYGDLDVHDIETSLRQSHFPVLSARETILFSVVVNLDNDWLLTHV